MKLMPLALLLLAGCSTIEFVRTEGERSEHALMQAPRQAAGCMARNVEREFPGFLAVTRAARGAEEVVVRGGPDFTFAVADVIGADTGSRALVWLRPQWFHRRSELVPTMIAGC